MFNTEIKNKIDKNFSLVGKLGLPIMEDIEKKISKLPTDEKYLMKYIYSNLPISDISDYGFKTYHSFVTHSLDVRKKTPWGKNVPLELFLTDVVSPRINNEKIEDHRRELYNIFSPYIKGINNIYDAAVELNYASLEFGTYKSPSRRTASPLTFLKRTFGRCGEESTFTASLLRSFSIPARQIYTPRWAHSDDCHAWVEVWVDGYWHYLGACEPEPFLDKGWFNSAATRAMLLHARVFDNLWDLEKKITVEGPVTTLSRTEHYAKTKEVRVSVKEDGQPLPSALVTFSLINYAHSSAISSIYTDEAGEVKITLGIGSIIVNVQKGERFTEELIDLNKIDSLEIDFSKAKNNFDEKVLDFDMIAPKDEGKVFRSLDKSQVEAHKQRISMANNIRSQREELGISSIEKYKNNKNFLDEKELIGVLESAKLNGQEVLSFLNKRRDEYGFKLLKTLDEKDLVDMDSKVLEDHLEKSMVYATVHTEENFVNYVLAPRISFEEITPYKSFIQSFFDLETKKRFMKNPKLVFDYIEKNIKYNEKKDFEHILASPKTILEQGYGDEKSNEVLAVAILRSIGVPSKLNSENGYPQYLNKDGKFIYINEKLNKKAKIVLVPQESTNWNYGTNWAIERLDSGRYRTFGFYKKSPEMIKDYDFIPGEYRIMTVNRLSNGNTLNRQSTFTLGENESRTVKLELRKINFEEMFLNINLGDFKIEQNNKETDFSSVLEEKSNLVVWIGQGQEPTEHLLTEMISSSEVFNNLNINIVFIAEGQKAFENKTVTETLFAIPKIKKIIDRDFYQQESVARNLYVNPEELPLVMISREKLKVIYAFSGYKVGLSDLITNIIK